MTRSTHIDARAEAVADDDAAAVGRIALPADLLTPLHDQLSARAGAPSAAGNEASLWALDGEGKLSMLATAKFAG